MSTVAPSIKTAGHTAYRVFVLIRGSHDYDLHWRYLGEHWSRSRAAVALDEWLLETDCLPGQYRVEAPGGYTVTRHYQGEESAA